MNYCNHCGSAELDFRIPDGDNRPRYVCRDCHTVFYSNPRIIAGCLPVWEDQVLLCRRAIQPRNGFWNVPSGFLENGETVQDGAKREVWEEAEARVEILGVHAVFSIPRINQVYIHFLGRLAGLDFGIGHESSDTRLFTEAEIPWNEMAFESSVFTLTHYFRDRREGTRRTHLGHM